MPLAFHFTEATHRGKLMDVINRKTHVVLKQHPDREMYWQATDGSCFHRQTGAPHPDNTWPPLWLDTLSVTPIQR